MSQSTPKNTTSDAKKANQASDNSKKSIAYESKKPVATASLPLATSAAKTASKAADALAAANETAVKAIENSAKTALSTVEKVQKSVGAESAASVHDVVTKVLESSASKPVAHQEAGYKPSAKNAASSVHEIASKAIEKTANTAKSTLETAQKSTKAVVTIGTDKIKEMFNNTTQEAQKNHAKVFDISREGGEHISRTLNAMERTVNDVLSMGRQNIDVLVEVSNIVADITRTSSSEIAKNANQNFSGNMDVCAELLACSNVKDAVEISNKWLRTNMDAAFAYSASVSEMFFQILSEASEPVNEHLLESSERFGKNFAA